MEGNRIRLASDFYITRDGTPAASIVVRTGAPDKVMEAARDLQDIIRRMSGAELPICDDAFRVEGTSASKPEPTLALVAGTETLIFIAAVPFRYTSSGRRLSTSFTLPPTASTLRAASASARSSARFTK